MSTSLSVRVVALGLFGLLVSACSTAQVVATDEAGTGSPASGGGTADSGTTPGSDTDAASSPTCGRATTLCPVGAKCDGAPDCQTLLCIAGLCQTPSPADGVQDNGETDIDCGGLHAPACGAGLHCLTGADCTSGVCTGGICQAPTHTDGVKNGDETGVDCGGSTAPKCPPGKGCLTNADCDNVLCDALGLRICLPASHTDGLHNGDETGVDCGGPTAPNRCPPGQGCNDATDCNKVACNPGTKVCDPPSSTDLIQNGTETDVDCGGGAPTNAPACAVGLKCVAAGDCLSTVCNYASKCVEAPSCAVHNGGDTCGHGEVGMAGAAGDSCCKSVPLADNSARLDKYEITAGRVREFIRATGGDVQTWVLNHRVQSAQVTDAMVQYLPTGPHSPQHTIKQCKQTNGNCPNPNLASDFPNVNQSFGVLEHLGNNVFLPDRPCPGCGQGCWVGSANGQVGHPTYYWDPTTQSTEFGAAARTFDATALDVKSLNCVTPLLLEAFCAWDGGTLATFAQLGANSPNSGWGTSTYPWGATPAPKDTTSPTAPNRIPYAINNNYFLVPMPTDYAGAVLYNSTNVNVENAYNPAWPEVRYAWPTIAAVGNDTAFLIAPPGRFANDYRAVPGQGDGYYDVAGNLLEATGDQAATDDPNHNGWTQTLWVGGSFEGHPVGRQNHNLSIMTKYGKMGGRCARPL